MWESWLFFSNGQEVVQPPAVALALQWGSAAAAARSSGRCRTNPIQARERMTRDLLLEDDLVNTDQKFYDFFLKVFHMTVHLISIYS